MIKYPCKIKIVSYNIDASILDRNELSKKLNGLRGECHMDTYTKTKTIYLKDGTTIPSDKVFWMPV